MIPLGFLQSLSEGFLSDACTIQRRTEGTVTGDGTTASYPAVASNVPCAVQPDGSATSERQGARGGIVALSNWRIRLPHGTDVRVRDRILVGARTFEVQGVRARSYEAVRVAICVEID